MQAKALFEFEPVREVKPFSKQLLKWIGNKQRFAYEIASYFPEIYGRYWEPFLGSGAVLGTLAPENAFASDAFEPLIEIWNALHNSPETLKEWYSQRRDKMMQGDKVAEYEKIKASYNARPNGADLVFLCRACYGGVVRFRQSDGYMSTPCGVHTPIPPEAFSKRVDQWHHRTRNVEFQLLGYEEAMNSAQPGDIIYCDPPYTHTQAILYGAQSFDLKNLLNTIDRCKTRGVNVALSIDGTKSSGNMICDLPVPKGLFEREVYVNCGRSMLKRFQMGGQSLENEVVADRLLLTY